MPKISIFMSSYNYAKYLRDAIDSVLNQTFTDFELYIMDDASTDNSWDIIQSYSDPRLITHRNQHNQRSVQGINHFISDIAQGELIAVHHSDNVWAPDKLEKQIQFLGSHPEVGAVFTSVSVIDEQGQPFEDQEHPYYQLFDQPNRTRHEWLRHFFYQGNALCHPSVLIRKRCYEECGLHRFGLGQLPDLDMWVRLCLKYDIHILPERLVSYRMLRDENFTSGSRPDSRIRFHFDYLQVLENYLKIASFDEFVKVFPTAEKFANPKGFDLGFVLGMTALEERGNSPVFELFGLDLLFSILQNPDRAEKVKRIYGFTHKDFVTLNAQHDVFSVEIKANLNKNLAETRRTAQQMKSENQHLQRKSAEKERTIRNQQEQLEVRSRLLDQLRINIQNMSHENQSLSGEITQIKASRTWKLGTAMDRILKKLAPTGSWREKILKGIYRSIITPIFFNKHADNTGDNLDLIQSSGYFDEEWYLAHYPDVASSGMKASKHYLLNGGFEGRDPGPIFSSAAYLAAYQDVRKASINPLVHYLKFGKAEGRDIQPSNEA